MVDPGSAMAGERALLDVRDVSVNFGGVAALDSVNLTIAPNTTVGLIGPNGAGKSTLFNVASGLLSADHGSVWLDGVDITEMPSHERARRGMARTFQHPELFANLTARESVRLADLTRVHPRRMVSDLLSFRGLRREDRESEARVQYLLDLVDLTEVADQPTSQLPLGTARLVEVARALANNPRAVLLDEPSSGLDEHEAAALADALVRVRADRGCAYLLVEHDVELVFRLSDWVYVLDFGRVIAQGTPAEVRQNDAVREVYLGARDIEEVERA